MKGFDAKFIDELKNKNDIIEVAGKYVSLEQRGGNYWGRCPFHHEKTPSFTINPQGQFYYCFGCHKSGDVISFVMELESLDFNDAVKLLAERAKMPLPEVKYDDEKVKEQKKYRERLFEVVRETALFYIANLRTPQAQKHNEYILKRGFNAQTVNKFALGASLNFGDLPDHLLRKGFSYKEMTDAGVVSVKDGRYYDALGGRLVIPMINQFNQVIAFSGRLLEKTDFAKYKNTQETPVFSKSNTLFNINNLKKLKNEKGLDGVIVVEGHLDVISLVQAGFPNVVASMGTSLTKDQARILKRYTDKVLISYDGDFAGQKAAIRGLEILSEEGLEVKVVALPDGLDPDDVVKKFGYDGYKDCLNNAKPLIDFKIDILKKTFDVKTVDGKRKFIAQAMKVIRESALASEQEDLLKQVRDYTGVTFEALKRDLYSEEPKAKVVAPPPEFNDNSGDKSQIASRAILSAYLFSKPYALENDLSEIEFDLPIHKEIQKYILDKQNSNLPVRFNDLYELAQGEDLKEVARIAGMETDQNKNFDEAKYFFDCLASIKREQLSKKIQRITALYSAETDVEKRRSLASEMSNLIKERNKIKL